MFLSPRSRKKFPCNHIWRKTVGERQAVMWNKCCTKKAVSWRPIPANLSRWFVGLVHWGTGTVPREVLAGLLTRWHLIPVLIFFFFFYSWFFGLAYSGELGHGQDTRACICGAQAGWWEALGKNPNRDEDSLVTTGHFDLLGITGVSCEESEGRVPQLFQPSSVTFIGDPACSIEHLESWHWCGPKWPDDSVWYALDKYGVAWPKDGLRRAVIILETLAEDKKNECLLQRKHPVYIQYINSCWLNQKYDKILILNVHFEAFSIQTIWFWQQDCYQRGCAKTKTRSEHFGLSYNSLHQSECI